MVYIFTGSEGEKFFVNAENMEDARKILAEFTRSSVAEIKRSYEVEKQETAEVFYCCAPYNYERKTEAELLLEKGKELRNRAAKKISPHIDRAAEKINPHINRGRNAFSNFLSKAAKKIGVKENGHKAEETAKETEEAKK